MWVICTSLAVQPRFEPKRSPAHCVLPNARAASGPARAEQREQREPPHRGSPPARRRPRERAHRARIVLVVAGQPRQLVELDPQLHEHALRGVARRVEVGVAEADDVVADADPAVRDRRDAHRRARPRTGSCPRSTSAASTPCAPDVEPGLQVEAPLRADQIGVAGVGLAVVLVERVLRAVVERPLVALVQVEQVSAGGPSRSTRARRGSD